MVLTISSWSKLLKTAMLLKFSLSCQMHTTTAGFELTNREPRFADGHRFFVDYFVQFFVTFASRNFLSVRIFVLGKPRRFCLYYQLENPLTSHSKKCYTVHYFLVFEEHFGHNLQWGSLQPCPIPLSCWTYSTKFSQITSENLIRTQDRLIYTCCSSI